MMIFAEFSLIRAIISLDPVLCQVVQEYQPPEGVEFKRVFLTFLNNQIDFLFKCRPKSIGMGTAISFIKSKIRALDDNITAEQVAVVSWSSVGSDP